VSLVPSFRGRHDREIPLIGVLIVLIILLGCSPQKPTDIVIAEESVDTLLTTDLGKSKLSEYGFFQSPIKELKPAGQVFLYELNSPLFSDYAFKKRFIYLPKGKTVDFSPKDTLSFPEGAIIIKNFYYPADFQKPDENWLIIETRLLIRESYNWKALTYLWNAEQTDAQLEIAGAQLAVSWKDKSGTTRSTKYSVPNLNQCKSCHMRSDKLSLIGPVARQLNKDVEGENQLVRWQKAGLLHGLPDIKSVDRLANYESPTETLDARARGWLEVNCAHCHRLDGPAKTSGLHLLASVNDMFHLGVGKPPVAAGKGSGSFKYDIVPGKAEQSILYYRIASTDLGVMMPELGRSIVHDEGLDLITRWINEMK
jgi:uncharacterized repeat protein (TIGR03806 family)